MISPKKLIIGTANFNTSYGILKNKLDYKDILEVLYYSKKKKIQFLEVSKDYKKLEIKSKNLKNNFKLFKKIDLQSKYFSSGDIYNKILDYLFDKKRSNLCYGVTIRKPNLLLRPKGKKIYDLLLDLKKNREISKIGITIYDTKNLKNILKKFKIDYIQLPYNFVKDKIFYETKRLIKNKNIEIHLRSIFLQGLLLKKNYELPLLLKRLSKDWLTIDNYLESKGINRLAACLNFAINSGADKLVIGINNVKQLKQILNIKISKIKIKKFEIKEKKLIDPIYWSKLEKNESHKS